MVGTYQAYPEYKDSDIAWLGKIPIDWKLWKLTHAYDVIGSGTTPPSGSDKWYGGDVPWVTTGELRETEIVSTSKNVTQDTLRKFPTLRKYPKGSIAIAMYGATIGRLGVFGVEATTNQACCVLTKSDVIDNKYLYYWLQAFKRDIVNLASGGGQPNINQEVVASLKISSPDISLQRKIANFLDYETAKIDTLIEKQQQLIKLLKEKRQAVISHAVTKGLNPNAPMRDSGIEWLGEVPEGWEVFSSKHLFPESNKKAALGDQQLSATQDYGVISQMKFMQLAGRRVVQLNRNQELRKRVDIDDFIISMRSFQGGLERAWDEGGIRSSYVVLKPSNNAEISFYQYLFKSVRYIQALQSTTNFIRDGQDMSYQNFVLIDLPLPPLEEQQNIASFLRREIILIDQLVDKATQLTLLMQERRTALISAAVTGKIDVRNWQAPQPSNTSNNNYKEVAP